MSKYVIKHPKNFEKIRLIGAEKKIAKISLFFILPIKVFPLNESRQSTAWRNFFYFYAHCRQWCGGNEGISPVTYWFKDKNQEQLYREQRDEQYPWYVVASNVVYTMMFCIQIIYLPRRVPVTEFNRMLNIWAGFTGILLSSI